MNVHSLLKGDEMDSGGETKVFLKGPKRKKILDAALLVFTRKGYGETSVPDIAREAGVAVGTIYNYFPSKRELLAALMADRFFTDPLLHLLETSDTESEVAFLKAFFEGRIKFGYEAADHIMFMLSEVQRDPEVRNQYIETILHPILEKIQSCLASGMQRRKIKALNPAIVSRAIAAMGLGFILLYSIEKEKSPVRKSEPKRLAQDLTGIILEGLKR